MNRRNAAGDEYAPFEDDYRGFDVREDEGARGPLILALAVGVLLIFGGVVWNTYRQGVRPSSAGLPSVIAEAQPFKTRPLDPGGKPIPHTDKQFYDAMDSSARTPEMKLASAENAAEPDPTVLVGGPPVDLRPATRTEDAGTSASQPRPPAEPVADVVPAVEPVAQPPKIATVTTPPLEPIAPLSATARFKFAASGPYLVQIAALRSEEAAETAWRRIVTASPELYHGANKHIQRADLGSEGVFYRLRVGAFADRSEAVAFCEAVKQSGANCIVVTA